jgi:hypothetical protein
MRPGRQHPHTVGVVGTVLLGLAGACALVAVVLGVTRPSSAATATPSASLVLFTAPADAMFVNNDDDEARGDVNNPFGTREGQSKNQDEENGGPFPGDAALFSFTVYTRSDLTAKTGSAVFTCHYAFGKNAFCNASFELKGSLLFGAGPLNFGASRFTLAITGGSGKYAGASGELRASPSGKHGQRMTFVLG